MKSKWFLILGFLCNYRTSITVEIPYDQIQILRETPTEIIAWLFTERPKTDEAVLIRIDGPIKKYKGKALVGLENSVTFIFPAYTSQPLPQGLYFWRSIKPNPSFHTTTVGVPDIPDEEKIAQNRSTGPIFTYKGQSETERKKAEFWELTFKTLWEQQPFDYPSQTVKEILTKDPYPPGQLIVLKTSKEVPPTDNTEVNIIQEDPITLFSIKELTAENTPLKIPTLIARTISVNSTNPDQPNYRYLSAIDIFKNLKRGEFFTKDPMLQNTPLAKPLEFYLTYENDSNLTYLTDENIWVRSHDARLASPVDRFILNFINWLLLESPEIKIDQLNTALGQALQEIKKLPNNTERSQQQNRLNIIITDYFKNFPEQREQAKKQNLHNILGILTGIPTQTPTPARSAPSLVQNLEALRGQLATLQSLLANL